MEKFEEKVKKYPFLRKTLNMPSLKPSDYFLYDQERKYFDFDMRELVVLGLRVIYACQHGQISRDQMLDFALQIKVEDLDLEDSRTRPTYTEFSKIPH
jgi:hypothetical protein